MAKKKAPRKRGPRKQPKDWVDYAELRTALVVEELLNHFEIEHRVRGQQVTGPCPFHDDARPSFSLNRDKGVWQCFGCGLSGNVLDLAVRLMGADPDDPEAFRRAALAVRDTFAPDAAGKRPQTPARGRSEAKPAPRPPRGSKPPAGHSTTQAKPPADDRPVVVNAPLPFELTQLDGEDPYLAGRGLSPDTIEVFGLGACHRGLMNGRIAIPLHDAGGELIGYAGRLIDTAEPADDAPKYLFPGEREQDGTVYRFEKSRVLYNGHRLLEQLRDDGSRGLGPRLVGEGFASVWWLHQCGLTRVVALMGSSLSEDQAERIDQLLVEPGRIVLLPDGDDAGERLGADAAARLSRRHFVRWPRLARGEQPTDLEAQYLLHLNVEALSM